MFLHRQSCHSGTKLMEHGFIHSLTSLLIRSFTVQFPPAVQTLVKEAGMVRETKDKQIMELKKMVEDSNETQRNEYEKRVCFTNLFIGKVLSCLNHAHLQTCLPLRFRHNSYGFRHQILLLRWFSQKLQSLSDFFLSHILSWSKTTGTGSKLSKGQNQVMTGNYFPWNTNCTCLLLKLCFCRHL